MERVSRKRWGNVGFVGGLAVDPDAAVVDEDGVAGKRDDALDVAFFRIARVVEDDDVAAGDFLEAEEEFVDEEAVLVAQAGLHAGAFDAHRLIEDGDDDQGGEDGDADVADPYAEVGHVARPAAPADAEADELAGPDASTGIGHWRWFLGVPNLA